MKAIKKKIFIIWSLISVLLVGLYTVYSGHQTDNDFLLVLNVANIAFFIFAILLQKRIDTIIESIKNVTEKTMNTNVETVYRHELTVGLCLVAIVVIVGIYVVFLSIVDVREYSSLIAEDGIVEYASAILWFFAAA